MTLLDRLRAWLIPVPIPAPPPSPMTVSDMAMMGLAHHSTVPSDTWKLPEPAPGVMPTNMAFDWDATSQSTFNYAIAAPLHEGLGFLGYSYLAELAQRPEYRRVTEIIATEATRKWIKLQGTDKDRIIAIEKAMQALGVRDVFRKVVEHDGFFGRGQIYIDTGHTGNSGELAKPLAATSAKIGKGRLKGLRAVEPFWSYPGVYGTTDPLSPDYYVPQQWNVMGRSIHTSRMLTVVGREMPDILKPVYAFGGLSLSQMVKPYVDNWLRTRQSVSDLVHSFSTMVLSTDMSQVLSGGVNTSLIKRLTMFNLMRDNRGVFALNKETEELSNVTTPLATLDNLQAQAQEQMASPAGIPLIVLLGVTPMGLNASSDGEMRAFYGRIKAYQEQTLRAPVHRLLDIIQLSEFGNIDESVSFEFHDLWEMDELAQATMVKTLADADTALVNGGVISPEEARTRKSQDERDPYYGVDLSAAPPEPEPEQVAAPKGKP